VILFPGRLAHDPEAVRDLAHSLERDPPAVVGGVASTLYVLSRTLLDAGLRIPARGCWSGGGRLYPHYREAIEAAFECPVHERYRCIEAGPLAYMCPEAGSFHLAVWMTLVEVVRADGSPAAPGEIGEVLVTPLRNGAMPLLRYRIGDVAEAPSAERCHCGRGLPTLGRFVGRLFDVLVGARGRLVIPELLAAVLSRAGESVVEFEVVQRPDLSVDVRVVQRDQPPPEEARERIAAELDALLEMPGASRVQRVDEIRMEGDAKYRRIYSEAVTPGGAPVGLYAR
jgi:phenylacetate-CoA ligase